MKRIFIFLGVISVFLCGCSNSEDSNKEQPYQGTHMINGIVYFSSNKDSINFNDTFTVTTALEPQKYRMKATLELTYSGILDTALKLITPMVYPGEGENDTIEEINDRFVHIKIDLYPNQSFSQDWVFITDSVRLWKNSLNYVVGFTAILKIDSIYLDMDTLADPKVGKKVAVPEKKWYKCRGYNIVNHPDALFLRTYFCPGCWWHSSKEFLIFFKQN